MTLKPRAPSMGNFRGARPADLLPAPRLAACWVVLAALALGACAYTRGAHESAGDGVAYPPAAGPPLLVRVAEIGVPADDLRAEPGLADARIGFGLSSILVEALADSGRFDLMESEEAILARHRRLWQRTEDGFYAEDSRPPDAAPHEYDVRARVSYARAAGRTVSLGPFTSRKDTLLVSVTACLEPVAGGDSLCRDGQGQAEQQAGGAFYEYQGDRAEFEKSAAGLATRRAVRQAVYELVGSLPPHP